MTSPIRPKFVQARTTFLAASITDSETTEILLSALVDAYGNQIVMGDLPQILYLTIDPGLDTEEIISCTDFTVNPDGTVSLDTGIVRGLAAIYPYGAGGTAESHAAGCVVLISNNPQIYEAILDYVENVAISGAPNASSTVKGIVQGALAADINAGTEFGSTGALLSISPDQLALSIYNVQLPTANQKAALAGSAGSPSGANLYITAADVSSSGASGLIVRANGTALPALNGAALTGIALARFGGTGADGALSITSGTTTVSYSSAAYFVKNYSSVSITGTGALAFSNPHANGTITAIKSQGAMTLTSSATPMLSVAGMGAAGGTAGTTTSGTNGNQPNSNFFNATDMAGGGGTTASPGIAGAAGIGKSLIVTSAVIGKFIPLLCGAGGGGGGGGNSQSGHGGAGGNGGGVLYIECAGALNFTTAGGISVAGSAGAAGTVNFDGSGGGGGGGGMLVLLYNSLTANSGTVTVTASSGGAAGPTNGGTPNGGGGGGGASIANSGVVGGSASAGSSAGGAGGAAVSLIIQNVELA